MAADSSFNQVQVLVQGGSATNVAPPPTAGSAVTVVNHGATLGADHLAFTTTAWLALDRDTPDTVANCIEIILEHSWSPGGQIFELLGRGDLHSGPGRIAIYADPNVENGYIYQHSPNYVAGPDDLVGGQQKFVLPAPPMRVLLRIQTRTVGSVLKRTIDIIPETGAPVYIDGGQPAFYDWDNQRLYPMTVGATTGSRVATPDTEAFARVTRLANPNRVGQEDAISRIAVDWVMYPFQRGYTTANTGSVLKDITLTIGAFGGAVSASVTRHNTTGEPVVAELIGKFTAALIAAGYSASYSSDGWMYSVSVAPPLNGGDWDFNFSIDGSWVYEDPALDRGTPWVYSIGSSVTQRGYSSSGPNSFQRERITVFVADPNKQYEVTASLSDPAWLPATTATELIGGGESVEAGLARLSSRLGLNGSWSQPSVGMFVIDHGFSDYLLHAFSASLTEVRSLPSAITKLYALRITYVARTENTFPTLPWPTTSIGGSGGGGGSGGPDPYASNVVLLLRLDGDNGSTSITDETGKIVSTYGNAQISTAQSKFGGAAAYFDGTYDYLVTPSCPDLNLTTGDWTIEAWVYLTAMTSGNQTVVNKDGIAGSSYSQYDLSIDAAGKVRLFVGNGAGVSPTGVSCTTSSAIALNTWAHVAGVKHGADVLVFLNGVLEASATAAPMYDGGQPLLVGWQQGQGTPANLNGYIDDVRITKGVARYTASFTPPGDLGVTADVVLLLHGDGANNSTTFVDSSHYAHTLVQSGNAYISNVQSQFGGTSIRFGGSDGRLSVAGSTAFDFGTGDFTIEAWVYLASLTQDRVIVSRLDTWASQLAFYLGVREGPPNRLIFRAGNGAPILLDGNTHLVLNTWVHVAVTRASGTTRLFVGGVAQTAVDISTTNIVSAAELGIGVNLQYGNEHLDGYIDDLRITKGVARYTASFAPPSTALGSSTGGGGGGVDDVLGAQYVTLADFTSVGTGAQQAFAPDAYGTSSVTLAGVAVAHSVTVNGNSINGAGTSDALAGLTCSGAGVAATPTNLTGACTLDGLVSTASGVASTPIEVTIATTLEGASQEAYGLTLVPAEATGAAVLDAHFVSEFTTEMTTPPTAQVAVVMPAPVVSSTGSVKDDRITAQMSAATALSWGHAIMTTRLPSAAASATGTVVNIGALLAVMPMPTVVSDGRVAGSSAMFVACPSPQSAAFGAGEAHAALSGFAAAASVTTGATAQISAAMPMAVVVASLTRVNTGQIIALMPMLIPSAGAAARLTMPMARVFISGNALAATGFEAYVLNLGVSPDVNLRRKNDMSNAQLTRYTNYPFTQIVRFRDAYYGVAADGLYRLGGLTDAGAPITWAVDLCTTDFDTPLKKTLVSVYLGGSAGPNVDFTVRGGETADMMHAYTTSATAVQRNHRQRFGLGRKTRYYSLGLSGQGALDLDSLDFEVANTTRRI